MVYLNGHVSSNVTQRTTPSITVPAAYLFLQSPVWVRGVCCVPE